MRSGQTRNSSKEDLGGVLFSVPLTPGGFQNAGEGKQRLSPAVKGDISRGGGWQQVARLSCAPLTGSQHHGVMGIRRFAWRSWPDLTRLMLLERGQALGWPLLVKASPCAGGTQVCQSWF